MTLLSVATPVLAEYALDHALSEVVDSRTSVVPFVITEQHGERRMHRFETPYSGQSTAAARYFLRANTEIDRAVLVWDGFVTIAGRRMDAVMAEYCEAGSDFSTITARRYRPARMFSAPLAIGETILVGEGHPLF